MTVSVSQTTSNKYRELFDLQRKNQYRVGNTSLKERKEKIKAIKNAIEVEYRDRIREAVKSDLGKAEPETDLTEIFPIVSEAKHALRNLRKWVMPYKVPTPLSLIGATSWIKHEPKGVCLIISPWNFPFNLSFGPLMSAIAAGNTVIIKPSEMTPNCSALMSEIIEKLFNKNEVALIEGGIETSTALLDLPFNHIFFTGAPAIGKIVMTAAAKNLTSVTLELGGKSPTIVDETAHIPTSVKRIAWGKFANNGQICIAPDYVFVHESKKEEFCREFQKQVVQFYGKKPEESGSFSRIVNQKHFDRIKGYLEDAVAKGAKILTGGEGIREENFLPPTVVEDVSLDSALMTNEIFGPVLPVFSYHDLDEPIRYIQKNEKPLALYIYSKNPNNIAKILDNTRAGGTVINHNDIHFFNSNLPFGGVNNSGIGKGHGKFGFEAFSNPRGVMRQHIPNALELLMPPYNDFKRKLIEFTIKWF